MQLVKKTEGRSSRQRNEQVRQQPSKLISCHKSRSKQLSKQASRDGRQAGKQGGQAGETGKRGPIGEAKQASYKETCDEASSRQTLNSTTAIWVSRGPLRADAASLGLKSALQSPILCETLCIAVNEFFACHRGL